MTRRYRAVRCPGRDGVLPASVGSRGRRDARSDPAPNRPGPRAAVPDAERSGHRCPNEFRQRLAGDQPGRPGRHPHRGHPADPRGDARGRLAAGGADHRPGGSHRRHPRRRLSGARGRSSAGTSGPAPRQTWCGSPPIPGRYLRRSWPTSRSAAPGVAADGPTNAARIVPRHRLLGASTLSAFSPPASSSEPAGSSW